MAIALLLLALTAVRSSSAQGTPSAWLVLCSAATGTASAPFIGISSGKALANTMCSTLNAGRDPMLTDLQKAVPAAIPIASVTGGMSVLISAAAGAQRGAKPTITQFLVQTTADAQLPPDVLYGLISGNLYSTAYILSAKFSAQEGMGALISAWVLRSVLVANITTEWDSTNGVQYSIALSPGTASLRVYLTDATGQTTRYSNVACYNSYSGLGSTTTDMC